MRLEVLQAYVRLVEVGSFSQVAQELRVQQSTVSKWLAELEGALGVPLVQRTTRQQRVTEAGQRFYARAREVVELYAAAVGEAQQQAPQVQGRLRVSVPSVFGHRHVLPHLASFLAAHPRLEVEMRFSERYVNLLEEDVDLAIRVGVPVDSSCVGWRLGGTPRRLVAAPDYLRLRGTPRLPQQIPAHDCLLHTGLSGAVWSFQPTSAASATATETAAGVERVSVQGRFAADSSEALRVLARSGLGVALLAAWLVDADVAAGTLVVLLPEWTLPDAPIWAVMPPGRRRAPPRVRALVAHLQSCWQEQTPFLLDGEVSGEPG